MMTPLLLTWCRVPPGKVALWDRLIRPIESFRRQSRGNLLFVKLTVSA